MSQSYMICTLLPPLLMTVYITLKARLLEEVNTNDRRPLAQLLIAWLRLNSFVYIVSQSLHIDFPSNSVNKIEIKKNPFLWKTGSNSADSVLGPDVFTVMVSQIRNCIILGFKSYLLRRCLCGRTDKCGRRLWSDPYRRGSGNIQPDTCARNKRMTM